MWNSLLEHRFCVYPKKVGLHGFALHRIPILPLWTGRLLRKLLRVAFSRPLSQPTKMVHASRVTISINLKKYYDLILFFEVKSKEVGESWGEEKILEVDGYGYKAGGRLMEMLLLNAQRVGYMMKKLHLLTLFLQLPMKNIGRGSESFPGPQDDAMIDCGSCLD